MKDLRITLFQPDIIWKNKTENLSRYTRLLEINNISAHLLLLPEMFQTGFCVEASEVAEKMTGDTVRWMKRMAEKYDLAVAGSLAIQENRKFFNRLVYIDQHENMTWYDKRHLFSIGGENESFTSGKNRLTVPVKDWQVCFQICYDLRFPVWSRNMDDYDLLVYVANWPADRTDVWKTLLKARAIENQAYVAGVNRVGTDGNALNYSGNSMIIDPKGRIIAELPELKEGLINITLSWSELENFRNKFPAWKDKDNFRIV